MKAFLSMKLASVFIFLSFNAFAQFPADPGNDPIFESISTKKIQTVITGDDPAGNSQRVNEEIIPDKSSSNSNVDGKNGKLQRRKSTPKTLRKNKPAKR